MTAYPRPRAAIGVFETPDALCSCVGSLAREIPDDASYYVLAPSKRVGERCAEIASARLSAAARRRLEYVEWRQPRARNTVKKGVPDGTIGPEQVSAFREWLDNGVAGLLEKHLSNGETVLFVPAPDAAHQLTAFREMRKHVSEKVILQDLPI